MWFDIIYIYIYICIYIYLVGGLEQFLFSHILGIIIPIDYYFSEGFKPPTSLILFKGVCLLIFFDEVENDEQTMTKPTTLWEDLMMDTNVGEPC